MGKAAKKQKEKEKEKTPNPRSVTGEHVALGLKLRASRLAAGISQDQLGKHLGISFQQVQKYEKGVNRIDLTRLIAIAKALNVPLTDFTGTLTIKQTDRDKAIDEVLSSREGSQMIAAMIDLSPKQRQLVIDIARRLPQLSV